jgi:hypothetical protein
MLHIPAAMQISIRTHSSIFDEFALSTETAFWLHCLINQFPPFLCAEDNMQIVL